MKPWPAELAKLYPLPPWPNGQRHPVYPWWVGYAASSGHPCSWDRYPVVSGPAAISLSCRQLTEEAAQAWIEEQDRLHPLPHPGVRVGQTWALLNGAMNVFTITEYDPEHEEDGRSARVRALGAAVSVRPIIKPWHCGGSWISDEELRDLVGLARPDTAPEDQAIFAGSNAYLLADAVCPWLAPWSSP